MNPYDALGTLDLELSARCWSEACDFLRTALA
jgi:hypothetical protein